MYLTIQAVVLRVTAYNDSDALLTLLSRTYGKLTVKARGLRRRNSPLTAPCQLLAYGEFTIFEKQGKYTINEARLLEMFQPLRRDLARLSLGTYFAEVTEVISQEDMPSPALQSLLLNCLYALSKLHEDKTKVKAAFELRAACLAGYQPDLTGCHLCGNQLPDRFDLSEGRLECSGCRNGGGGIRMPITLGMLEAMRYLCNCPPQKMLSFSVGQENLASLSELTEAYLTTQLERGFYTLDFYKQTSAD